MKQKNYPLNQVDDIQNIKELIQRGAEKQKDRPAFIFRDKGEIKSVSYQKLKMDVDALGTALFGIGIRNSHIAILGENSYAWILTALAAINGSNVAVPIDKELTAGDIGNIVVESGCRVLVYSSDYSDMIDEIKGVADCLELFIEMGLSADKGPVLSFPRLLEKGAALVASGDHTFIDNEIDNDAMAVILFTSGTTGKSKGAMLSHRNIATDIVGGLQNTFFYGRSVLVLPLHHTFSFVGGVLLMLHTGSSIFITSSLKNFVADMQYFKPYEGLMVPMMIESFYKRIWEGTRQQGKDKLLQAMIRLCSALSKIGIDLRGKLLKTVLDTFGGQLKIIISGGALIDPKYLKGFRDFGDRKSVV
jgi:long-chain acyl-CoA synthetase